MCVCVCFYRPQHNTELDTINNITAVISTLWGMTVFIIDMEEKYLLST